MSPIYIITQGLLIVIIIGMTYYVWETTKVYGGLIGKAVRFLGIGMLFVTIAVIEKAIINYGIIENTDILSLVQDVLNLFGLFFLALGFSKLAAASKPQV